MVMQKLWLTAKIGALVGAFVLTSDISAQATVLTYDSNDGAGYTVSSSDLLQVALGGTSYTGDYLTSSYDPDHTGTASVLIDGTYGSAGTQNCHPTACAIADNAVLTYTLDTTTNTRGYDISSIAIYSGWNNHDRDDINVTVSYATVANPQTYLNIATAAYTPSGSAGASSAMASITGINAKGVQSIKFQFGAQEYGYGGYNEIDVIGSASAVPEPSICAMACATLIGFLAYAWRKRK